MPDTMEQGKKPGIAEAIEVVEYFHDLMLSDENMEPKNVMAILHQYHQCLIRTLKYDPVPIRPLKKEANSLAYRDLERASRPKPEAGNNQHTPTNDSKDGGVNLPSGFNRTASSERSFATVQAWLERIEPETPSASEANYRAGAPPSHDNTANSTKASFTSLHRQERDTYGDDDPDEGGDSRRNP